MSLTDLLFTVLLILSGYCLQFATHAQPYDSAIGFQNR